MGSERIGTAIPMDTAADTMMLAIDARSGVR